MNKFLVIEARRLLPLMFLVALLISLSVYDNFFRVQPADTIPVIEEDYIFMTTTRGEVAAPTTFHLIYSQEQWNELKKNPMIELPDYPFNDSYEVALCTVNSEIEDVQILPEEEGVKKIEVQVKLHPYYYHIVMINRDKLDSANVCWTFLDKDGKVLMQELVPQEEMVMEER